MKLDELNEDQKSHLAWRLDNKTCCGMITASSIARGDHGNLDLVYIFQQYGDRSKRSAQSHARLVEKFEVDQEAKRDMELCIDMIPKLSYCINERCKHLTWKQTVMIKTELVKNLKRYLDVVSNVSFTEDGE